VEPTPAGKALIQEVRELLDTLDDALARARLSRAAQPTLRLAFTPTMSFGPLQEFLDALAEDLPGLTPDVRELWADDLPAAVREGRFDAGIGIELPGGPGLEIRPWRTHRVDLLVAASHPFATARAVAVAQLDDMTVALPDQTANVGLHDALAATFSQAGVTPAIWLFPRVSGAVPASVANDGAASVWLTGMEDRYIPDGFVRVHLIQPETIVTSRLVTTSGRQRSEAARAVQALQSAVARTGRLASRWSTDRSTSSLTDGPIHPRSAAPSPTARP
jgi:DNA-binding transcriptional LysR family regulator